MPEVADTPSDTAEGRRGDRREWGIFLFIAGYLVLSFLWRMLVTAHEVPSRPVMAMTMLLDGLMVLGLLGVRGQAFGDSEARKQVGTPILFVAVLAGLGLFVIRFTSGAAWHTGHLLYQMRAW